MLGKAELEMRREPVGTHVETGAAELLQDVRKVLFDEMRQHEPIVQLSSPPHQALRGIRCSPEARDERSEQELLRETHLGVRGHFERPQLEQPEATCRAIGRVQLVDAEFRAMGVPGDIGE